jgi:HAE1 family hydrophobic/amphiphilic exporter-1
MLSEIAEIQLAVSPIEIEHIGQERVVKVSADIEHGVSLSEAVRDVQQLLEPYKANPDVLVELSGQNVERKESFSNLSLIFFIGLMLVYMIMVAQFKSLKAPFIILFTIPFALIGVIIAFSLTNVNLNLVTFVGVIMLLGVVVNNGIVLVDYTNLLRARKYGLREAVVEAGRSRLRPVLMTSLTTVLGMFPMALSKGLASEIWSPLGITMIGGLLFSTLITLILMPVTYEIFFKKNK